MRKISEDSWGKLLEEIGIIADSEGLELWHVEYKPEGSHNILRIFVDKADGINIDECATVSRHVSVMLDIEGLIDDKYSLEVSSPGLDRKLVKPTHFEKYLGRKVKIKLSPEIQGRKKFGGTLDSFENGVITLTDNKEGQEHKINFDDVHIARLAIEI